MTENRKIKEKNPQESLKNNPIKHSNINSGDFLKKDNFCVNISDKNQDFRKNHSESESFPFFYPLPNLPLYPVFPSSSSPLFQ